MCGMVSSSLWKTSAPSFPSLFWFVSNVLKLYVPHLLPLTIPLNLFGVLLLIQKAPRLYLGFLHGSGGKEFAMQETKVWSLGQADPLEKGMATYYSLLAWKIPRTEEPGGLQSTGQQRVGHDWVTDIFLPSFSLLQISLHYTSFFSSP